MKIWKHSAAGPLLACTSAIALSACGGGGGGAGGVNNIPNPPDNPQPVEYTQLGDLEGDQTFQTATLSYQSTTAGLDGFAAEDLGTGTEFEYDFDTDTFSLRSNDGGSVTMGINDVTSNNAAGATFEKTIGNTFHGVDLPASGNGTIALFYTQLGGWLRGNTQANDANIELLIGGMPTIGSDMPTTGTASYNGGFGGGVRSANTAYNILSNRSDFEFTADFGAGTVQPK